MALIGQMLSVSYPAVLNDKRKPANQWADSTFLTKMEQMGGVRREDLGTTIDRTLDYRANPGGGFLTSDLQPLSLTKTEVITTATYDIAQIAEPITWSNLQEVQNPTENQKVALVASLLDNGIESHDDLIEQAFFATSTNGFLGLPTHITTNGQGSDGGIDSGTETWWRNKEATYSDDTDIEAAFTSVWNACSKGSGSKLQPTLMVSDGATNALFEGTQQALQRWSDSQDFKAGAKSIMFKTAPFIFSQYGTTTVYFINTKNLTMQVSRAYFRDLSETMPLINQAGWTKRIYSALQLSTNNRSRLGCAHL